MLSKKRKVRGFTSVRKHLFCSKDAFHPEITLMDVRAYITFVWPSIFVLRTRRMCWNFSGTTRLIVDTCTHRRVQREKTRGSEWTHYPTANNGGPLRELKRAKIWKWFEVKLLRERARWNANRRSLHLWMTTDTLCWLMITHRRNNIAIVFLHEVSSVLVHPLDKLC